MFGNLFDSDGLPAGPNTSPARQNNCTSNIPDHRGPTNLCGIENLGATCYLNSLVQTLFFTPEFREGLVALDLEPRSEHDKVRVIPLTLQKLFAQLLLHDVANVSTCPLTESFGWTDHEDLYQQQDVQELIRILFFAIQKSLVGTPGHDLISSLYQGTTVSQVQCQSCQFVSVRDESYLDLTVAVAENRTLKSSLFSAYCEPEAMTGSNQYLCPTCKSLTDATKVVKLRHLPPILTLSLLRFLYDPVKQQRFKDESRLEFPLELDMAPFCEDAQPSEVTVYELLSVIVHRGGAHGGHYHTVVNDIDKLGQWDISSQTNNVIRDPTLPAPELLITEILKEQTDSTLTLEQLLDKIFERIGLPWSKSYKTDCGSIGQFLNSHCSLFFVEGNDLLATVTLISEPSDVKPMIIENGVSDCKPSSQQRTDGRQWFDLNDTEVLPVSEVDMEKYFEGEEVAYMLVYRRKSLKRPEEAIGCRTYGVPRRIQSYAHILNTQTHDDREASHLIWLRILPRSSYNIYQRTLFTCDDKPVELELTIDEREPLSVLKRKAMEVCAKKLGVTDWKNLNMVQQSGFNLVLQDEVPESESISLEEFKIENGHSFLAWNCDEEELEMGDTGPLDYAWEESVECQPLQHCAVVHDCQESFQIIVKNTVDGLEVPAKVNPSMTVRGLRELAEWELNMAEQWLIDKVAVRLGEDLHSLEPPLHDHLSLADACIKPDSTVYLEPCSYGPILPNQVWLSFSVDDAIYSRDTLSLVMANDDLVGVLISNMMRLADLDDDEAWHVGRTNMSGDVIQVLNNPQSTLMAEKLVHGTHLVLKRGSALQRGLTRIKIMELEPFVSLEQQMCPSKAPKLSFLGHVDMDTESATLTDLKHKILTLREERTQKRCQESHLRVRMISKTHVNRPSKVLKDSNLSLKAMEIGRNTPLVIQVLPNEEHLRSSHKVLQVWRHIPGGCQYTGPHELVWDLAATSLAEAVSHLLNIKQHNLVVARYQPRSRNWTLINVLDDEMLIEDQDKDSLPLAPSHFLNDGDTIGVKDASLENGDLKDFTTTSDLERWLRAQEENESQQRINEEAAAAALEWTSSQAQSRLPERGITIHVSDFC